MNKFKEMIPHILSASRIVLSPIIIFCGLTNRLVLTTILIVLGVVTDYLDGKVARIWKIENKCKFSIDSVGDKIFIASSAFSLILANPVSLIPIPLELAIGTTNIISHLKGFKPKTNKYGQTKQALLYLTYFLYALAAISKIFTPIAILLTILTTIFQTMALSRYINKYNEAKNNNLNLTIKDEINEKQNNNKKDISLSKKKSRSEIDELKSLRDSLTDTDILNNCDYKCYRKNKKTKV